MNERPTPTPISEEEREEFEKWIASFRNQISTSRYEYHIFKEALFGVWLQLRTATKELEEAKFARGLDKHSAEQELKLRIEAEKRNDKLMDEILAEKQLNSELTEKLSAVAGEREKLAKFALKVLELAAPITQFGPQTAEIKRIAEDVVARLSKGNG